mgnify:FL=1
MKKRILSLVLVLAITISIFSIGLTTNAASALWGDANGDGKVTTSDALIVLRVAAGIEDNLSAEARRLCDVNEDGFITLFDARKILRSAAGLINLQPTGAFSGFNGGGIFETKEELVSYFNKNLNRIKEEKFGFTKTTDVEMKKFEFEKATIGPVETENTDKIISGIFSTVDSEKEQDLYVVQGTSSVNKINVEGQAYVSALLPSDVYGATAKYDANRQNGVVTISIAIPDAEKCDVLDSSYAKVFNSENLLGATESTLNKILSGIADGSEVVHYKNAILTAEFDVNTNEVIKYSLTYDTEVYIPSAQNGLVTLKEVNYKTTNTIDYIDFTHPTQK